MCSNITEIPQPTYNKFNYDIKYDPKLPTTSLSLIPYKPKFQPTSSMSDKPIFAHLKTFANNTITSAKQFGGKVYTKASELAKNPMTYAGVGSFVGGAALVGASVKAILNRKSQGIKEQLPTLVAALGGAVVIGLSQIAAGSPSARISLAFAGVAGGVVGGVTVAISSKKAAQV